VRRVVRAADDDEVVASVLDLRPAEPQQGEVGAVTQPGQLHGNSKVMSRAPRGPRGKKDGNESITAAKITLMGTLSAALITAAATVSPILFRDEQPPNAVAPPPPGTVRGGGDVPPSPLSARPAQPAQCAYVTKKDAWVFTAPNTTAKKLRPKPIDSGITILNDPHPPGWTPVLTPFDDPKRNWMQTDVLSVPYSGESPCPDKR
jgi:hypothetical protein